MDIQRGSRVWLRIMSSDKSNVFRLPKKHKPKAGAEAGAEEGARLVNAQSMRDAIMAGLIVVILFSALWSMASVLIGRIFPWLTLVQGMLIGLVIRRAGHGIDWRFAALAAMFAIVGSLVGNIVVAAAFTAAEFDTGTLTILRAVTVMTWPVFFAEVMTPADVVYALFAAAIAAFYANRRLSRSEFLALRKWQQRQGNDTRD